MHTFNCLRGLFVAALVLITYFVIADLFYL